MVFWWVCVPVPFYMFCPSFHYQSTLSGSVSKRQVVLFLEGSALCPSTSHHCPLGAPSHVNRSRVASHLALLSCLNVSEFPGDIPASLSLWTPHSLCKHVYTLWGRYVHSEVFVYLDDVPRLMELTTGTCVWDCGLEFLLMPPSTRLPSGTEWHNFSALV